MTETNARIHVLADETLGGIKREYVEVDRKAEVNEKIVIVDKEDDDEGYGIGAIFTVDRSHHTLDGDVYSDAASSDINHNGLIYREEYHVLEPTDIVHIYSLDGMRRCVLTDRKAEVGEEVIFNNESGVSDGIVTEVTSVGISMVDVAGYEDSDGEYVCGISHGYYRVLVPVEAAENEPKPADPIDVIANLAQEVASLKRTVDRHRDEIDTLFKDKRTLGEELARLKEPTKTAECAPIDAPLVFIQRKIGDAFDVYQDGKKLRGVRHIRIDAASGEFTTLDVEFVSGTTEEERP
ncbi:hypothetical protein AW02_008330 [Bacillus velezensis NJN-6]|uniref:hypothetical protein n=1 Tax=Bacillus velezensis TaxID=492670 RepID=UPI00061A82CC|nr:hypothetical protein [Bacillus velezensis]AKD28985.1 hypothetical protein AW02_008330 [Bacillus velezensis NJN-6]